MLKEMGLVADIARRRSVFNGIEAVALSILGALAVHAAPADSKSKVFFGPEPGWTLPAKAESPAATPAPHSSELFLFLDRQINAATAEDFHRTARQVLSAAGVQNGSRLTVNFDPSYAQLNVHQIQIRRGTQILNRLKPETIRVIQREKGLEQHLLDGELSAVAVIEDVRVGDVIEYAYTIKGRNPAWDRKFCESILLGWPFPIKHSRIRLLWPANHTHRFHYTHTLEKPVATETNGIRDYIWELHDTPAVTPEADIPAWYNPYPRVEFSNFRDWTEVAHWASRLFAAPPSVSAELQKQIDEWRAASTNSEQRLITALQFVQEQVRYLGIENGIKSHQPSDPSVVFSRRFGDCKDKSVLLCAILNRLGFEAVPALVNSHGKVDQTIPSPLAFNHAIVETKLGEKTVWVDPTLSYQQGPLHLRYLPDYGHALLVRSNSTDLTVIPKATTDRSRTFVREWFSLNATNRYSNLRVATAMEGREAEAFRAGIGEGSVDALGQKRLSSYARYFPLIHTNRPAEIHQATNNFVQVIDDYTVPDVWTSAEAWRLNFDYFAHELGNRLAGPANAQRTMPLAVEYPSHRLHTTILHLPASLSLRDTTKIIRGPVDELRFKRVSSGKTITLEYDYHSTADSVSVAQLSEHLKARREMLECMGLTLWWRPEVFHGTSTLPKAPKGPLGWTVLGFAGVMFLFWMLLNRRQSREAEVV